MANKNKQGTDEKNCEAEEDNVNSIQRCIDTYTLITPLRTLFFVFLNYNNNKTKKKSEQRT